MRPRSYSRGLHNRKTYANANAKSGYDHQFVQLEACKLSCNRVTLTVYDHIKTAEQRTIVQKHGDWYAGR